jgi:SWIM/SEC-C metal-binding protein
MKKVFDGKTTARLGTPKNPAVVSVQTEARAKELEAVFAENGWAHTIQLEAETPENISDLEILLHPTATRIAEKKVGRNAPCPCGSGKKYKKCCEA